MGGGEEQVHAFERPMISSGFTKTNTLAYPVQKIDLKWFIKEVFGKMVPPNYVKILFVY